MYAGALFSKVVTVYVDFLLSKEVTQLTLSFSMKGCVHRASM